MRVKAYVAVVVLLAAVAAGAASAAVPAPAPEHVADLVLLFALLGVSEWLNVRVFHVNHAQGFNLIDGLLGTLVFIASGRSAVLVAAIAVAAANLLRRNAALKALFNVAQWTLAAGVGALVMHALRPPALRDTAALPVLLAVIVVVASVNAVAMGGVLRVATGSAVGSPDHRERRAVLAGQVVGTLASLVTGVCLAATYVWNPWAMFAGVVVVLGLHASGRANASLRADGVRLAGLQRATHAVATSLDADQGLADFLAEVRAGFEVRAVELVLTSGRRPTVHRCDGPEPGERSIRIADHALAREVVAQTDEPVRLHAGTGSYTARLLKAAGHDRAIAVPLCNGSGPVGVLFLYDRVGLEGVDAAELAVAAAVGSEVVSFLDRVALVREVEEERRKLAGILGATSEGICAVAVDGTVTAWNTGLAAITGYTEAEVVGTRQLGLLRPRDANGRDVVLERWADVVDRDGGLPDDLQVLTADGHVVWLACSYSRLTGGDTDDDLLVVVARNVTQARELERLKDDFIAVVSHELRTPLVPIKGWAQTLLNRGERMSDAQRHAAAQSIFMQAQKLESLVLDILEASRVEAASTDAEGGSDIVDIVTRLVAELRATRPDRIVVLTPPPPSGCAVKGSAVWVERAIANLLANAVKYSPDDKPVEVSVSAHPQQVDVTVTDHGPGIAVEDHERIFARFERLEETRTQSGTGLGLYITRHLARAMGGDVTVTSAPMLGATFRLRLPRAPEPTETRLPGQRAPAGADGGSEADAAHVVRTQ